MTHSVPAEKLNYFRMVQDAKLLAEYMREDEPAFPYSLTPDPNPQHLDLDKLYPLVDGFLNPSGDEASVFLSITHHGTPVIDDPAHENDDYLNVVYFLTPEEVQVIARAMHAIPQDEWEGTLSNLDEG